MADTTASMISTPTTPAAAELPVKSRSYWATVAGRIRRDPVTLVCGGILFFQILNRPIEFGKLSVVWFVIVDERRSTTGTTGVSRKFLGGQPFSRSKRRNGTVARSIDSCGRRRCRGRRGRAGGRRTGGGGSRRVFPLGMQPVGLVLCDERARFP